MPSVVMETHLAWTRLLYTASLLMCVSSVSLFGVSAEEHKSHHPGEGGPPSVTDAAGPAAKPGGMGSGMGGMGGPDGMGKMMEQMGAPKAKELYPTLMAIPTLSNERRQELITQAHMRMQTSAATMTQAYSQLARAGQVNNYAEMQQALTDIKAALTQFDSGLAVERALAEGKAPRQVALQWFRREMNLATMVTDPSQSNRWGWSVLHVTIMILLVSFFVAMIGMYFFKMRRATALLQKIAIAAPAPGKPSQSAAPAGQAAALTTSTNLNDVNINSPPQQVENVLPSGKSAKELSLRVARIEQLTPDVKRFRFADANGGPLPFNYLPGQYLTLLLSIAGKAVRRSYTISSSPTQSHFCEITVKREEQGLVSRYLHDQVHQGDTLQIKAPFGKFVFSGSQATSVVLIAGGVGVTPMMSILQWLTDIAWPGDIYFVLACKDHEHFIFKSEITQLAQRFTNVHVLVAMSRIEHGDGMYRSGRLSATMLTEFIPQLAEKWIHLCGAPPLMAAVTHMLTDNGVPLTNIHTESFGSAKKSTKTAAQTTGQATVEQSIGNAETAPTTAIATGFAINFKSSEQSSVMQTDETILEAGERLNIEIDNSCRTGTCGKCRVKLASGNVTMETDDGLEPDDKAHGFVLACQAKPTTDVIVDA